MSAVSPRISRRAALLGGLSLAFGGSACAPRSEGTHRDFALPDEHAQFGAPTPVLYSDSVDALCDVLLPAEHDDDGVLTSPGAREARVDQVLGASSFVTLAVALGYVPALPDAAVTAIGATGDTLRTFLGAGLDALAQLERPLTEYRDLPREAQERLAAHAFDDDRLRPAMLLVRTACLAAYAGGIASDVGLRELGFPPFEDRAAGLAVSGYPRTPDGRLIDASTEDLRKLAAAGELDDYSYRTRPATAAGVDVSTLLDARGDLL